MLVLIDAERDVESISRKKLGFLYAFCHMPSQRIELKRAFPVRLGGICFLTVSRWRQLQLHVLIFDKSRGSHHANGTCAEHRLGISHAEWFKTAERLEQLVSHMLERKCSIEIKNRLEVGHGQLRMGIFVQMCAQLGQARRGQTKA